MNGMEGQLLVSPPGVASWPRLLYSAMMFGATSQHECDVCVVLRARLICMRIDLYTRCWNDAHMLGFFFRHYDTLVQRYVI